MYVNNNPYALWFGATLQVRPGETFTLPEGYNVPEGCVQVDDPKTGAKK